MLKRSMCGILMLSLLVWSEGLAAQGRGPQGPGPGFRQGGPGGLGGPRPGGPGMGMPSVDAPAIPNEPMAKSDAEKKILEVLEDLDKNQRRGNMNVPRDDGRLLRMLVESLDAKHTVELGTSNGYSGIWTCLGLRQTGGKLTTFEIDEDRAALARENFARAGVSDLVTIVMGDAHENVKQLEGPLDLVFIDADKEGYLDYLEKLLPLVRPGGIIAAHNMRRPSPSPDYIKAITTNPNLETLFLHMDDAGIAVSLKKR